MRAADPVHNVELRRNSQGHDSVVFAFPYRADIVDAVRAIPGRRFDWEAKEWWAPRADAVAPFVKGVLERHPTLSVAPDVDGVALARGDAAGSAGSPRASSRAAGTSSWTRSPASWTSRSPSWPTSAAGACGCRSRARSPRRCWRPAAPAWTRARCAAPRACRWTSIRRRPRSSLVEGYGELRFKLDINWDPETLPAFLALPACEAHGRTLPVDPYLLEPLEHYLRLFGVEPAAERARGARPAAPRARLGDRRRAPLARVRRGRAGGGGRAWAASCGRSSAPASPTCCTRGAPSSPTSRASARPSRRSPRSRPTTPIPAVIVCPAGLKLNWLREIERWLPHRSVHVINGTGVAPMDAEITVLNYEIVHAHRVRLQLRRPKALVLDESHYVKNPRAKRTQAVRRLAEALPEGALKLALTGTPVMNHPDELIAQLRILGRLQEFGSGARFSRRFQGAGAEERIHWHLRRSCFVRRLKADVLPQLPAKRQVVLPVALDNVRRVQARPGRRDRLAARAAAGPRRGRGQGGGGAARRAAGPAQRAQAARRARQGERGAGLDRGLPGLRRAAGRVRGPPRGAGAAARALPGRAAHPRPRLDPAARGGRGRLPGPGRPAADRLRHARRGPGHHAHARLQRGVPGPRVDPGGARPGRGPLPPDRPARRRRRPGTCWPPTRSTRR